MLFLKKVPAQSVDIRNTLAKYKKDVSIALHKTVMATIDNSLEIISSHYIDDGNDE
jgi:hypothetical protein